MGQNSPEYVEDIDKETDRFGNKLEVWYHQNKSNFMKSNLKLTYFEGSFYKDISGKKGLLEKNFQTIVIPICAHDPINQLYESFVVFDGIKGDAYIFTFILCIQDYLENNLLIDHTYPKIFKYHSQNEDTKNDMG